MDTDQELRLNHDAQYVKLTVPGSTAAPLVPRNTFCSAAKVS
jgi:hypothetical protein